MAEWVADHWIETVGAITGIIYIFFSIRQSMALWMLGIVTSAFYVIVFFQSKFYADMSLQVYYFFISIYGWYYWIRKTDTPEKVFPASNIPVNLIVVLTLITTALTVLFAFILKLFTDSPLPWWDAFTTAAGITATWMLVKKYIENWLVWIVVDFVCVGLYFYKELYPTVLLYLVYAVMAFIGYAAWKKNIAEHA